MLRSRGKRSFNQLEYVYASSVITMCYLLQNDEYIDVDDVGNSIRQLALSVQDTGMFGDLPRPRIMNNVQTGI